MFSAAKLLTEICEKSARNVLVCVDQGVQLRFVLRQGAVCLVSLPSKLSAQLPTANVKHGVESLISSLSEVR